jgi:hypothetical protein
MSSEKFLVANFRYRSRRKRSERINHEVVAQEAVEEGKSGSQESTKETGNRVGSWVPGFQISLQG